MPAYIGPTVVHRIVVNQRRGVGETYCGIRFSLSDAGYDAEGVHDTGYLDWLSEHRGLLRCFCSHCANREPAWKRRQRLRSRQMPKR